jgi:hypothetical protein
MNRGKVLNQRRLSGPAWATVLGLLSLAASGCAALTNPLADALPVAKVPPELLCAPSRNAMVTIPLTLLRQQTPPIYRLGPNDVLGIYIEGVLPASSAGQPLTNPPIYFPTQLDPMARGLPPAIGFPINVREDGTIALPLVDPIPVEGKSIAEADAAIRDAYIRGQILRPGRQRIIVSLMQPRTTRVMVFRQEIGGFTTGPNGIVAVSQKRGSGTTLFLRANENDVLSAMAETGGLASLEDYNEIVIFKHGPATPLVEASLQNLPPGKRPTALFSLSPQTIVIPTRIVPGQRLPFRPQDILLDDGDILFLEARDREVFYTGGLLPATEQTLPRDYDLDVVTAILKVQGSLLNGGYNPGSSSGALVQTGLGNPSPSLLAVVRRTPDGGQVAIRVDLNRAMLDARERIRVLPGDVLVLQETPGEAVVRYITQVFKFDFTSQVIKTSATTGTTAAIVP